MQLFIGKRSYFRFLYSNKGTITDYEQMALVNCKLSILRVLPQQHTYQLLLMYHIGQLIFNETKFQGLCEYIFKDGQVLSSRIE